MNDVVLAAGVAVGEEGLIVADIGIRDGVIAEIGQDLRGTRVINCADHLVLPGGVDQHCHIEQKPTKNGRNADTFETASASAALGGTTTVICFAVQERGRPLANTVAEYRELAARSSIDHAFHLVLVDAAPETLAQLPAVVASGIASIKIFMTYDGLSLDDGEILAVLRTARALGCVVCVHAENRFAVADGIAEQLRRGVAAGAAHGASRPPVVEAEAVQRVIALAELAGATLQIFHVTCERAASEIARAQARGAAVHAETCTHYLTLTDEILMQPVAQAAPYFCSPPLRNAADQAALWARIADGTIGSVSSDHSPYRLRDPLGKLKDGDDTRFDRVASGLPGLATRLPVLFDRGVNTGRLSVEDFVRLTATEPARLHGLTPRRGVIAVGADADLAVWDRDRAVTLAADALGSQAGYTPFEGWTVRGWPVLVLSRGEIVAADGRAVPRSGHGRFLPRIPGAPQH